MLKNLKTRTYTSLVLLSILLIMIIDNFILSYVLIVFGILSILEFFKINQIVFKKNKLKQLLINLIFITYISIFCSMFMIFSFYFHIKFLIFSIILICAASDIGGYTFGKYFKGKKLTKISPNKTISGAMGSLILSSLTSIFIFYYISKNFDPIFILIGIVISIACQIGDLFFSYLKRKSLLKNTGNFLPGHGGILDRIDGLLLGLPVGFLLLLFIN